MAGVYSAIMEAQTVSTAITILQVTAAATHSLRIHRAWVTSTSTTSAGQRIQLLRKSATATVTAVTPLPLGNYLAVTSSAGRNASAEGTDGNILIADNFNVVNGWLYLPVPEERIIVPPSGIIALKFPAAPTSATFTAGFIFEEIG